MSCRRRSGRLGSGIIANIDEHLNGWAAGSSSVYARDIKKHVWAMNEVQRFFIEETRLGIPADFTNEGIRGLAFLTATSFPAQLGVGHTWDKNLVRQIGRITAVEARALGYTNVYTAITSESGSGREGGHARCSLSLSKRQYIRQKIFTAFDSNRDGRPALRCCNYFHTLSSSDTGFFNLCARN